MAKRGRPKQYSESDWYNRKQKEEFIESSPENKVVRLKRLFSMSAKEEKRLGKDLCDFTKTELINLYSYMNFMSYNLLQDIHTSVKTYVGKYQKEVCTDATISIYSIGAYELKRCCNSYVAQNVIISRKDLLFLLEEIKDEYRNPSDLFVILCIFEGIYGNQFEEILNLKITDFYRNRGTIYAHLCTGRTVKVSEELFKLAKETDEQDCYYVPYENCKSDFRTKVLQHSEYILKPIANKSRGAIQRQAVWGRIKRCLHHYNKDYLTTKIIQASGVIDMIERKAEELDVPVKDYFNDREFLREIIEQYPYKTVYSLKAAIKIYKPEWAEETY